MANDNSEMTFADGYIDGWRSVTKLNKTPTIPSYSIPAGKSAYNHGYEKGAERAKEWTNGDQDEGAN
jgi:hypothetical protein